MEKSNTLAIVIITAVVTYLVLLTITGFSTGCLDVTIKESDWEEYDTEASATCQCACDADAGADAGGE